MKFLLKVSKAQIFFADDLQKSRAVCIGTEQGKDGTIQENLDTNVMMKLWQF